MLKTALRWTLIAFVVLAFGKRASSWLAERVTIGPRTLLAVQALLGVYGGYFGGGVGLMMTALYGLLAGIGVRAMFAPRTLMLAVANAAAVHRAMLDFAEAVRADERITDVVNIGIGGSDLGPRMVVQALRSGGHANGPRVHFIANMDGHELAELLPRLQADSTVFIIASKTFGTAETMQNAASARAWFLAQGGSDVARHFVALSANTAAVEAFGAGCCFAFDEGVGGRFSLWSSIGLSIAIAIGDAGFMELLAGAHAMDRHFASAPLESNLPVQLALLDLAEIA